MSAFKPASNAVAIDLGTTRCRVGVWRNDAFELITDCFGNRFTPSWVAFTEAERVVGEAAQAQAHRNTANTVYDIKRLLGLDFDDCTALSHVHKWPFRVVLKDGGQTAVEVAFKGERSSFSPEEIAAVLLGNAKQMAETRLGSAITHAVITVPSYFSAAQRQALMHAASAAGLPVVRIAKDTSCAALAYHITPSTPALCHHVVVCNLGGGPCSASLVLIDKGVVEVVAVSASSTSVSGADFDQRLLSWCVQELRNKHCKDASAVVSLDNRALHRLCLACERAKCILSCNSETIIEVDALFEGADFTATITRSQFEEACDDLFCRIVEPVNEVLRISELSKESIGEIVVCGGGARMPKACYVLQQLFGGKQVNRAVSLDEAVTQGAALLAASLIGSTTTELNHRCDFLLLDVLPISLGISGPDGSFLKIIDRNSTLPCRKSLTCTTSLDYQTTFMIRIYEGEDREIKNNRFLGAFELKDIPPAPKGVAQIDVCFDIDCDGGVKVLVHNRQTQKCFQETEIFSTAVLPRRSKAAADAPTSALHEDETEAGDKKLHVGARVIIHDLISRPDANLQTGVCMEFDKASKRWVVQWSPKSDKLRVQLMKLSPKNLTLAKFWKGGSATESRGKPY